MHVAPVEIYSDATNAAIMRHPGRKFPGVVLQGDTLYVLCRKLDAICEDGRESMESAAYTDLNALRNQFQHFLVHYKNTLAEHGIPLPFSEDADFNKLNN
jgi:hypothetical protein